MVPIIGDFEQEVYLRVYFGYIWVYMNVFGYIGVYWGILGIFWSRVRFSGWDTRLIKHPGGSKKVFLNV